MSCWRWCGRIGPCLLACVAVAPAQVVAPIPGPRPGRPPYRLGLIDSRTTAVEVIPGVTVRGLEVLGIHPGSPAGRAGLAAGDIILAANAARIIAPDDLRRAMTESGGVLRLKVFEARTEQVLNMTILLDPGEPGPRPTPIQVTGRVQVGVVAIGAETTGITLTTVDGRTYDLDFTTSRPPPKEADGKLAFVTGFVIAGRGPERTDRRIIRVSHFRLVGGRRLEAEGAIGGNPL